MIKPLIDMKCYTQTDEVGALSDHLWRAQRSVISAKAILQAISWQTHVYEAAKKFVDKCADHSTVNIKCEDGEFWQLFDALRRTVDACEEERSGEKKEETI